ncbi:GDP-fucose synthetase [Desulfonema ishimotonii]|uniref:GDP-L-fucose synthase n=1 Tax=Desulfonema ishimotonii TaxID=45657 RepID=A0A401FZ10_9BACT|nr:GDP-L-fucose synthase [Desulfonema ishimotonii]GBC62204.1 GDP-fucose synthetase [Desulfonema ishimotonii]
MNRDAKIYVAGHRGLVGSAILRKLREQGCRNIISRTHRELDLTSQDAVKDFFEKERPEYVFLAAAKVGGILGNATYPADFIYQNLAIQTHVIHAAWQYRVKRLLFLGSSCIYPRDCPQPMKEEYLMTGPLEPTNAPYAVAKIAGIEMCWAYNRQYGTRFIPVMPTNLYGIHDNFNLETSHVLPALIRKFHLATLAGRGDWEAIQKDEACYGPVPPDIRAALGMSDTSGHIPRVVLWGSGSPRREFLHADDLADACVSVMSHKDVAHEVASGPFLLNIGCGTDLTIREIAETVAHITGFDGTVIWDADKPDGTPQKLLDVSRLNALGWQPRTPLAQGVQEVYDWYVCQY